MIEDFYNPEVWTEGFGIFCITWLVCFIIVIFKSYKQWKKKEMGK